MFTTSDLKKLLQIWAETMSANADYLIKLDGVVGDSDLGLTMADGFKAASEAAQASEETDFGKTAYNAGKAMSNAVPSTMGTLMASGLMAIGKAFKGAESIDDANLPDFFQAYFDGVRSRGKAEIGDKTFLDGRRSEPLFPKGYRRSAAQQTRQAQRTKASCRPKVCLRSMGAQADAANSPGIF